MRSTWRRVDHAVRRRALVMAFGFMELHTSHHNKQVVDRQRPASGILVHRAKLQIAMRTRCDANCQD
jgi:hypothetical protein